MTREEKAFVRGFAAATAATVRHQVDARDLLRSIGATERLLRDEFDIAQLLPALKAIGIRRRKRRAAYAPKEAFLRLAGWHGTSEQRVLLVGETPKRWRIRAIAATRLSGRDRWLAKGDEALVPRSAVRIPNGE